jgi:serine/threonine-protein kinase
MDPMSALPDLRIKNRLGMSGCAQMFLADDPVLDRRVLIQLIRGVGGFPEERRRLMSLSRIRHPSLVAIHQIQEISEEGSLVLVMEYVAGSTLAHLIADDLLDLSAAVKIGREIAGALGEIHAHGLFHGDLRTDNILISPTGEVKILPGVSLEWKPAALPFRFFDFLDLAHPLYPEPFRGAEADSRSDLFALGAILYEMVTGVSPFEDLSRRKFMENVSSFQQVPAAEIAEGIPPDLSDLIQTLLAKRPEDRSQSAAEVEERLAAMQRIPGTAEPEIEQLYRELRHLMDHSAESPQTEAVRRRMERLRELQQQEALALRQQIEAGLSLKPGAGYQALREAKRLLTRDEDPASSDESSVRKD